MNRDSREVGDSLQQLLVPLIESMTRLLMRELVDIDLDDTTDQFIFIGDSPNDAPSFAYFPHAVGVANIRDFVGQLDTEPAYITTKRCGAGFAEVVDALLSAG